MKKLFVLFFITFVAFGAFASGQGGKVTFGVTIQSFDDVFMQTVLDAVKQEAKNQGVKVVVADAKSDTVEQLKIVDNFITSGVDAIIVHPINQDIARTITKKAVEAGTPLVYLNRRPNDEDIPAGKKVAAVASPEEKAGAMQAEFIAKKLGGKGRIAILLGGIGSGPQIGRTKGVKDYLKKYKDIKIVKEQTANWQRPEALSVVENWLASGSNLDAILANNDEMAIGAAKALLEKGVKSKVLLTGVDASADGIAALEAGDIDLTVFQNGKAQGAGSIQVALKMVNGESFKQDVQIPFEKVTKENASKYKN